MIEYLCYRADRPRQQRALMSNNPTWEPGLGPCNQVKCNISPNAHVNMAVHPLSAKSKGGRVDKRRLIRGLPLAFEART